MADRTEPVPLERAPLAYENTDFLNSSDGRLLRITSEYVEPLSRFRRERIQDTVVFFGSARIRTQEEANRELEELTTKSKAASVQQKPDALNRAQAAVEMSRYYEDARRLAFLLTEWSKTLGRHRHRFVVTSGGGPGIMEAANRGAYEAGGKTIGLNIRLPFEQVPNSFITPSLNFEFHYFFMRKLWFAYMAKALVVFPGGFGTFDEMFEVLTLAQTHKLAKKITVLVYGKEYWSKAININMLIEKGVISPQDLDLFHYVDTPEEAFAVLKQALIENELPQETEPAQLMELEHPTEKSLEAFLGPEIAQTRK
jgi:hypothetical protein